MERLQSKSKTHQNSLSSSSHYSKPVPPAFGKDKDNLNPSLSSQSWEFNNNASKMVLQPSSESIPFINFAPLPKSSIGKEEIRNKLLE
eukprot:Awhi_evm1s2846